MSKGVIVSSYGILYRMSKRNYKRLIKAIATEQDFQMRDFGKLIGSIEKDITDLTADDAKEILEDL